MQDAILTSLNNWRNKQPISLGPFQPDIRTAIRQQHKIGWLDLLECLPAKEWQSLQQLYYREQHIRKSSRKWIRGLLAKLHHLAHKQWRHRNHIKTNVTKPSEQEHIQLLHEEITHQYTLGPDQLLPGDKSNLNQNLLRLLARSLPYKKGWYTSICAARQRAIRKAAQDDSIILASKASSALYQFLKTHKERPTLTKPLQFEHNRTNTQDNT
jgi:hypothetical protein